MSVPAKFVRLAVVLALCLLIPACVKNKVTKVNYEKITDGMTMAEVEKILGKGEKETDGGGMAAQVGVAIPSAPASAGQRYKWEGGDNSITINFIDGMVKGKYATGF
jgi:hypothetical protein